MPNSLEVNLPKAEPLTVSDEERFSTPDKLSEMSLREAIIALNNQYLMCKRNKLPPTCQQWLLWSATFIRSWISRIQSEPNHLQNFDRKAFIVLWWNRGAALNHYSQKSSIAHQGKAKGIHRDAEVLTDHVLQHTLMNAKQQEWVIDRFNIVLPLVKRQILATIPPAKT